MYERETCNSERKRDKKNIPQNVDLLLLDHPDDLEMHHFVRKLPHWLIQAYNQKITALDVSRLIDIKAFNQYERSFDSCWARLFCCASRADQYQLEHHYHNENDHDGPSHQHMR